MPKCKWTSKTLPSQPVVPMTTKKKLYKIIVRYVVLQTTSPSRGSTMSDTQQGKTLTPTCECDYFRAMPPTL